MFGLPVESWGPIADKLLLAGLLLGVAALVTTTISAKMSSALAEHLQSENTKAIAQADAKVEEARAAAAKANEASAKAHEVAAKANERAAELANEAAQARLEQEKLKAQMAWRRVYKDQGEALVSSLRGKIAKLKGTGDGQRSRDQDICVGHRGRTEECRDGGSIYYRPRWRWIWDGN